MSVAPESAEPNKGRHFLPIAKCWTLPFTTNKEAHPEDNFRSKLHNFLHQEKLHKTMSALLVVDVCLVIISIGILTHSLNTQVHGYKHLAEEGMKELVSEEDLLKVEHSVAELEETDVALAYCSLAILCIFIAENLLMIIALGAKFFMNFWYVLDLVVTALSIAHEVTALVGTDDNEWLKFMVVGRAWRFVRIVHGVYTTAENVNEIKETKKEKAARVKSAMLKEKKEEEEEKEKDLEAQEKKQVVPPIKLPETDV